MLRQELRGAGVGPEGPAGGTGNGSTAVGDGTWPRWRPVGRPSVQTGEAAGAGVAQRGEHVRADEVRGGLGELDELQRPLVQVVLPRPAADEFDVGGEDVG